MALINQRTGYCGFTLDGLNGIQSDITGSVKKCIFSIVYPLQVTDVDFTISSGAEDWGAQMGDGSIIPLSNPKVLYQNRDNSIVEFDMETAYAANSPCTLVYRSDTAVFNITEHAGTRPFEENTLSGHFAFTTEGYGGDDLENGLVNRLIATIPFPQQIADIEFTISDGPDDWGARMGDGSIINLKNPEVIATNTDNAVIKFDMDISYPSNSPCIIVYRSATAQIAIKPSTKPPEFVPVSDVIGVPKELVSGVTADLSSCAVYPDNATSQGIEWSVVNGDAYFIGSKLTVNSMGNLRIKATVADGLDEGLPFTKEFDIIVVGNSITIIGQPSSSVKLTHGLINAFISVNAKSNTGVLNYKWMRNSINSITGAVAVPNGNDSDYRFPADLPIGTYYYFCEVSSPGANMVRTIISEVKVSVTVESIKITPQINTIAISKEVNFDITHQPSTSDKPVVNWKSTDSNIIQINASGVARAINTGNATIIATTIDGLLTDSIQVNVPIYISVANITNLPTSATAGTPLTLSGTVTPTDATSNVIEWSIVDDGGTDSSISSIGNKLTATEAGTVTIRALIKSGISPTQDYIKDFKIVINRAFIPVSDIELVDFPPNIRADQTANIKGKAVPTNADHTDIIWSITSAGTTGAKITDGVVSFTGSGIFTLRATIIAGISPSENYIKDFTITVNPAWIPVTKIELDPVIYDPNVTNGEPITLNAIVTPPNATRTDVVMTMTDKSEADAVFNVANKTLQVDPRKLTPEMEPFVKFELRIIGGVNEGVDFVTNSGVRIVPPAPPEEYIPVDHVDLKLPEPARCHYPILLNRAEFFPWNCSSKNAMWGTPNPTIEDGGADNIIYMPSEREFNHSAKSSFFDWNLDEIYMFPYDPGKIELELMVIKGLSSVPDEGKEHYIQNYDINLLPPYISVKDVSNVPIEIPCRKNFILSGELETNGGIKYHMPTWDEEIPSFVNLQWRIGNQYFDTKKYPNNAGAILTGDNGNIVYCDKPGDFTIQAYVENGSADAINWYGKIQPGESFTKLFTIRAVNEEIPRKDPIVSLTLNTSEVVNVYTMTDLNNLCTDLPSNSVITIGSKVFRKDQVRKVDFWDEKDVSDKTIPVTKINLSKTNIDTYELIIPEKELAAFSDVTPDIEADGCIAVINENSIFNGMHIIPENVFMRPDGSIIRYNNAGGEDLILNIKYASSVFKCDPKLINFPEEFIQYDNDYIRIPAGTILDKNGNLITTSAPVEADSPVDPDIVTTITIHGIVINQADGTQVLPNTTSIGINKLINLPDDYIYDSNTGEVRERDIDDPTSNGGIPLPYGTYVNQSKEICISDTIKDTITNIDIITNIPEIESDVNNFLEFSDGSFIFEDGYIFTNDGKLIDMYGREVPESNYINLNDITSISPIEATNKDIEWEIFSNDINVKIVEVPTDSEYVYILIAGNNNGHVIINGRVIDGFGVGCDYEQKIRIDVGDVSQEANKIFAINMDAVAKNVPKGISSATVNLYATLIGTSTAFENTSANEITWSLSGSNDSGWFDTTDIYPSTDKKSAELYIGRNEHSKSLTVTVTCKGVSNSCKINIVSAHSSDEPNVISLRNFGRNFVNLQSLNHIPSTVTGDDCLRNFLMGCTNFNQDIIIPDGVSGNRCLKYFMRNCTNFNSNVTTPTEIEGIGSMHGFMSGCTKFNKPITIPSNIQGESCLERFLMGCKAFNQNINIPDGVNGKACLRSFLADCVMFNKPIKIPDEIDGENCMYIFMKDCHEMTSSINVSINAARNIDINALALTTIHAASNSYTQGIPVTGTGARLFMRKAYDVAIRPYRHLITTEPEDPEYTITINQVEGVTVTPDLDAAFEFDTVELTVDITADDIVDIQLRTNDPAVNIVYDKKLDLYKFIMNNKNIVIDIDVTRSTYTPFTITSSNRSKVGYTGAVGEELIIPRTFRDAGNWYKVTGIDNDAFRLCNNLVSIIIPGSITSMGTYAFSGCEKLEYVTIRNGVTELARAAFYNCQKLVSVKIPKSVSTIVNDAFNDCTSLISIIVDSENQSFRSVEGILYNKDRTSILCCPAGTNGTFTIPNSVTTIGGFAFAKCTKLSDITIAEGVKTIQVRAFKDCIGLKSLTIPDGVTIIDSFAFENVKHIEYHGIATGSPWGAVSMN